MNHPACPRCSAEWSKIYYPHNKISEEIAYGGNDPVEIEGVLYCIKCNLRYIIDDEVLILRDFPHENLSLVWRDNKCYCGDIKELSEGTAIKFPQFSFNVSRAKIRTYIIFS